MFFSDDETGIEEVDGDRGGVLVHDVQLEPSGGAEEAGEQIDWESAFNTLSAARGREMVTGELVYMLAYKLMDNEGREAALRFAQCAIGQRDSTIHEIMG